MTLADSRKTGDEDLTKDRRLTGGELHTTELNKRLSTGSYPVSTVRPLDVDAVLARSVRKVEAELI